MTNILMFQGLVRLGVEPKPHTDMHHMIWSIWYGSMTVKKLEISVLGNRNLECLTNGLVFTRISKLDAGMDLNETKTSYLDSELDTRSSDKRFRQTLVWYLRWSLRKIIEKEFELLLLIIQKIGLRWYLGYGKLPKTFLHNIAWICRW